jgi:hypothetical protein
MKCEHTSERVGTEASQLLRLSASRKVRSVAGSALTQRKNQKRSRGKRSDKR